MLKIWGRADGSNVIKAMWCIGELGIAHERIDWGGEFVGNDDPQYRRTLHRTQVKGEAPVAMTI